MKILLEHKVVVGEDISVVIYINIIRVIVYPDLVFAFRRPVSLRPAAGGLVDIPPFAMTHSGRGMGDTGRGLSSERCSASPV